jgi:hypothetical protein
MLRARLRFHTLPLPQKLDFLMSNFQDMQAEVARYKDVATQVIGVLDAIPARIAAAVSSATDGAVDQSAFDTLVADLKATTDSLSAKLEAPAPASDAAVVSKSI